MNFSAKTGPTLGILHILVRVGGGLGILIGLGTVSNLETSLETIWLVPGLGSGPDWAWARFLEDDILCRR